MLTRYRLRPRRNFRGRHAMDDNSSESQVEPNDSMEEELAEESRPATPMEVETSAPDSPAEEQPGTSASTNVQRRTRSSGPPINYPKTAVSGIVDARRSFRKPGETRSTDSNDSGEPQQLFQQQSQRRKRPPDQPGVGEIFQAEVPPPPSDAIPRPADDEDIREEVMWLPRDDLDWTDENLINYLEIARATRGVTQDMAMKHLFDRNCNLKKALIDFEDLPTPTYLWTEEQLTSMVQKLSQSRKVVHIQKHFAEKFGFVDARARVVEKRYELLHRLCYGESRWLCPKFMGRITEEEITKRSQCENCGECRRASPSRRRTRDLRLCNCCALYISIYKHHRPFSVQYGQDRYIQMGLDEPLDYGQEKHHTKCFAQPTLEELRVPLVWSKQELMTLVRGFRQCGRDYEQIAERLSETNRTPTDVKRFYVEFKGRYNLDELIANVEHEQEPAPPPPSQPTSSGTRQNRRVQEDRTPTPAADDESANEMDTDDSQTVRHQLRGGAPLARSITTRNRARASLENAA